MTLKPAKKFTGIRKLRCLTVLLLWIAASASHAAEAAIEADPLQDIKARLAAQYPDVRHIAIGDYLEQHQAALLVDVRSAEEYAVSRIPGAIHIEDRAALLAFARQHKDAAILLYCSVGARSADAAAYLQQQNISNVMNLQGSIFEWANGGRPLENAAGPTQRVHPFNAWWGWRYLER